MCATWLARVKGSEGMKRVMVLLFAGTIISGLAAAYAGYAGTVKRGELRETGRQTGDSAEL
jgi:hypothetical protein